MDRIVVAACVHLLMLGPATAQIVNCPKAYSRDDQPGTPPGLVLMSADERAAYRSIEAYAREVARDDRATYLRVISAGLEAMTQPTPAPRGTSVAQHITNTAQRLYVEDTIRRSHFTIGGPILRPPGPVIQGFPDLAPPPLRVAPPSLSLQELSLLEPLARDGMRPRTLIIGEPINSFAFQSSVAIVVATPYDSNSQSVSTFDKRPLCSGTRIGRTGIVTAAHCVCALGLDRAQSGAKVRVGNNANRDPLTKQPGFAKEIDINAAETRCYPGALGGSGDCGAGFCSSFSQGAFRQGMDIAVIHMNADQAEQLSLNLPAWSRSSPISSKAHYERKLIDASERQYVLGFGFNPTVSDGAGLGVKWCGQMVAGPSCAASPPGMPPCTPGLEFILQGDPTIRDPRTGSLTDACPGDSGGGVFLMENSVPGQRSFSLAGIVSRGPYDPTRRVWEQCGNAGSIYSFASHPSVIEWISARVLAVDGIELRIVP